MSPPTWGTRKGAARPPEWRKTPGGAATEWAGESIRLRAPTPPEWLRSPGGTKPPEGPQWLRADRGRTDGGGGGGDENPPTAQATRTKGADGGKGATMGRQRTEELPGRVETAEDNSRAGPRPRQSHGTDGARHEQGALALREYDLLASEATKGGPANAGAAGSKDGHGALANREGTETEEEGDETPQSALPAQEGHQHPQSG